MKQYKVFNHKTLKRLKKFYLMFFSLGFGLTFILFALSLLKNPLSKFISSYMFFLGIGAFVLAYVISTLWTIIAKGPTRYFTISATSFDIIEDNKTISYPFLGLTFVEIDRTKESPAVLMTFVYNENNKVDLLLHHSFITEIKTSLSEKNINIIES